MLNVRYLGAAISASGFALSLFVEHVLGVMPCLTCLILRYSYVLVALAFLFNARKISLLLSVWILAVSMWGVLGIVGLVENPCISVCYLESERMSAYLFPLSAVGGVILTILSWRWGSRPAG